MGTDPDPDRETAPAQSQAADLIEDPVDDQRESDDPAGTGGELGSDAAGRGGEDKEATQGSGSGWSERGGWTYVLLIGAAIALALAIAKPLGIADGAAYTILLVASALLAALTHLATNVLKSRPLRAAMRLMAGVFALAAFLVVGMFMLAPAGPGPIPMTGEFNVAVAEFDADGDGSETDDAAASLSESLSRFVRTEAEGLAAGTGQCGDDGGNPTSGEDLEIRGPVDVGRLSGEDRESRAAAARELGDRIDADLVLYGTLGFEDGETTFAPEFVLTGRHLRGAEELLGHYELGAPLSTFSAPIDAQKTIREDLKARTLALAYFLIGLRDYRNMEYDDALATFTCAANARTEAGEVAWRDADGKEMLYLFIGNAAGKAGRLDEAEDNYDKALMLSDNQFARAHIGLGEVARVRARCGAMPEAADGELLDRAYESYEASLTAADQPAVSDIGAKAATGMGLVHLCRGEFDAAADKFAEVLRAYEPAGEPVNERIVELAAESHMGLGLVAVNRADAMGGEAAYQQAIGHYETAAKLANDPARRALAHGWLGWLYRQLDGGSESAEQNCRTARELGLDEVVYSDLCANDA